MAGRLAGRRSRARAAMVLAFAALACLAMLMHVAGPITLIGLTSTVTAALVTAVVVRTAMNWRRE